MAFRNNLDFSLAVTTWKALFLESRTNQERFDLVWQPTQKLVEELSVQSISTLTCFAGKQFMFPDESEGVAVHLFLIDTNTRVAYIGTLLNQTANMLDREAECKRLALISPALADRLSKAPITSIVRDSLFCKIPCDGDELDQLTATKAVQRYLSIFAPSLMRCSILWIPRDKGIALEQRIRAEAERTAKVSTHRERLLATAEDELDVW